MSCPQPRRKLLQQLGSILRPLRALLLVLHDAAANLEVRQHLQGVDRAGRRMTGRQDQAAQLRNQRTEDAGGGGAFVDADYFLRWHGLGRSVCHLSLYFQKALGFFFAGKRRLAF